MQFLNPYFLFASALIAIPVIIHLFNFRRYKTVYFSNVKFIEELKLETQKTSKLKHLLVLILRILAVLCLVFAFAQPYIPTSENQKIINDKKNLVSVFIDNSFSMDALSVNGKLIDDARLKAKEIASAYKSSDLFQLLTNDFEGRHQRLVSKEEFLDMVDEVKSSPAVKNISQIISRQKDALASVESKNKVAYIISDFQKNITDIEKIQKDSLVRFYFIPVAANETNNLYVDSCWFASPVKLLNHTVKLFVKIINRSKTDYEKFPVKLFVNDKQLAVASINIKANSEEEIQLPYTLRNKGIQHGMVQIEDYPITYDDRFYFSYTVYDKIPILSINGKIESDRLNALFSGDSAFNFVNSSEKNLDYSSFNKYKLILLDELKEISSGLAQELQRFTDNGGSLVVFPSDEIDLESYKNFLSVLKSNYYTGLDTANTKVDLINMNHFIYQNVFDHVPENVELPKVFSHYTFNKLSRSGEESLLKMQDGDNFLTFQPAGQGKLYLFAVPLNTNFSSLVKEFIFVPTLYQIALMSEKYEKLFYTIGNEEVIELSDAKVSGDDVYKLKQTGSDFEIIPEYKNIQSLTYIYTHNQVKTAGNYVLQANHDQITGLAFNYNRKESDLRCFTAAELKDHLDKVNLKNFEVIQVSNKPLKQVLTEINQGIRLWKLFVILALVFLAFEIFLLRFDKRYFQNIFHRAK